jgi:hypothetical protein
MKLRWKEQEMIFAGVLTAGTILIYLLDMYNLTHGETQMDYAGAIFRSWDLPFIYWRNVLLPKIATVLVFFGVYLVVSLLIIPEISKITFNDFERLFSFRIIKPLLLIVITAYLMAISINAISFLAKPHLMNYAGYRLLALFGYNPSPLSNLLAGFTSALGLVLFFAGLAGLREWLISRLLRSDGKRGFRIMMSNNITPLVFVFLLAVLLSAPVQENFRMWFAIFAALLCVYIYLTFWLFPFKGDHSFLYKPFLFRLLIAVFAASAIYIVLLGAGANVEQYLLLCLFLLFVITPLCWLFFVQRRDKIVELKGMASALAKSNADISFLRSQINPHFLFNVLNTLYGTAIKEKSEQTAEGIQKLGDMMRFMLHENNQDQIAMEKELEYLRNYIDIQRLRTSGSANLVIGENLEESNCGGFIAPMLLIPFVENAFKHGISATGASWVKVSLNCTPGSIAFGVRNSIHQLHENDTEKVKSGIGLKNVSERLKLLYPGKHILDISKNEQEFVVNLVISRVAEKI